tara:strand:+ start:6804 stop:7634 length:831 start_codon:yes stop_codon:yes gene_type:complete
MKRKIKHNKKRNTAFLYETLVREIAKSVINKKPGRNDFIISLVKEHFTRGTELARELELYKTLAETKNLDPHTAEKLIQESKQAHFKIDKKKLFIEQSRLISKVNRNLSKGVFSNFVPNYKNLATISQIFNDDLSVKDKVLLEKEVLKKLTFTKEELNEHKQVPVTNLIYRTFIKKFNETYGGTLLEEQKAFLHKYITSFDDNGIQLKMFLNEELGRLKKIVKNSLQEEETRDDSEMIEKTKEVIDIIESFKSKPFNKEMLTQVLKIQNLVSEIQN